MICFVICLLKGESSGGMKSKEGRESEVIKDLE